MPRPSRRADAASKTRLPVESVERGGTRERILDIALDLFVEQGYDKTSLREIAEALGVSKAALYYHFASKDDILLALHLRLHEIGATILERLGAAPATPASWGALLQDLVDDMLADRKLLVLHERNHTALEALGQKASAHHDAANDDLETAFREVLADPAIPVRDRVRLGAALGAVLAGLMLFGDVFAELPVDEFAALLREIVADLLPAPPAAKRRTR